MVKEATANRIALLGQVFDTFDNDKNGYLSAAELSVFTHLIDPHLSGARLVSLVDANRDRKCDKKEFIDFGLKLASNTPGAAQTNQIDQFTLAMRLALAAKGWVRVTNCQSDMCDM